MLCWMQQDGIQMWPELFWSVYLPTSLMEVSDESVWVSGWKGHSAYFYFWVDLLNGSISIPSPCISKEVALEIHQACHSHPWLGKRNKGRRLTATEGTVVWRPAPPDEPSCGRGPVATSQPSFLFYIWPERPVLSVVRKEMFHHEENIHWPLSKV